MDWGERTAYFTNLLALGVVGLVVLVIAVAVIVNSNGHKSAVSSGTIPVSTESNTAPAATTNSFALTAGDSGHVSGQQLEAFQICKQFVGPRLKAPGSATWRDPIGNQVTYLGNGSGPITVNASVDSQNSFGAKLRSTYSCTVTNTGGVNWTLDSLQFNDGGGVGG